MGQKGSKKQGVKEDSSVEEHVGRVAVCGRYHRAPRRIDDDYRLTEDELGRGCSGVVRKAVSTCSSKKQQFAVKAFKFANVPAEKRAQLTAEVEIFLSMDHPHVTRLFDVYESEDYLHLVMECMEGGELFDRITAKKKFKENDAAETVFQMLLALNYIHSHGIVHRDIKLENFLYDSKDSDHLKMIDFGFSKVWDTDVKMRVFYGTLSYVAPEVLKQSYTSKCDLWSLGVITFILLAGYMPFDGSEKIQTQNIEAGLYSWKPERWSKVSPEAIDFAKSLLKVDVNERLSAQQALEHQWIDKRKQKRSAEIDDSVVDGLRNFGKSSKFRRCCMEMMAWSLSNEERATVRQYFIEMDKNHHGTITLAELKETLTEKFHIDCEESNAIVAAMDTHHDEEIHYSDFLAAMVSTRIALHDDLLRGAFKRFDVDNSGYFTVDDLRTVLGDSFEGEEVEKLIQEADALHDGMISYEEFASYLRGEPLDAHVLAAEKFLHEQMKAQDSKRDKKMRLRSNEADDAGQPEREGQVTKACCCVS